MPPIPRFLTAIAVLALASCGEGGDTNAVAQTSTATTKATPVRATPARDWTKVVTATPEGGFRIGNPDAQVKFLEYASLTCPACRNFHTEAMTELKRDFIAGGRVSYELRNFVLNGPDLAVTILARCQGAGPYFKLVDAFYAEQPNWIQPFMKISDADQQRMAAQPRERQTLALADLGQIDQFMRLRGMPRARYEQCLVDPAAVDRLEAIRNEAVEKYKLQGTPTFVINGTTRTDVRNWPEVAAALRSALG